jgi:hypothetical protein
MSSRSVAGYLVLALAWTWPLPLYLSTRFTADPGDPLLVTYLLWRNAHAVPFTDAWWNAPFFWPLPGALALTEHVAGLAVIATPIQLLGGSPLLAYNLLLIASIWWSGLAMHALVQRLTDNSVAAAIAGVAWRCSRSTSTSTPDGRAGSRCSASRGCSRPSPTGTCCCSFPF